ncbi:hypothetical protein C0992_011573, partial [Termitomyces sp. T32_za158]
MSCKKKADKENVNLNSEASNTGKKLPSCALWNASCDSMLLEILFTERDQGLQTSNSSWHALAWAKAEVALAGSEMHSGGSHKSASSCQNRWTSLKKEYQQLKKMRDNISGFGWDDKNKLVTAPESVWVDLEKVHPNYMKWRTTPFPLSDDMANLVDGTVATGATVFCPGRARDASLPSEPDWRNSTPIDSNQTRSGGDEFTEIDPALDPALGENGEGTSKDLSVGSQHQEKGSDTDSQSPLTTLPATPTPLKRSASDAQFPSSSKPIKSRKISSSEALATVAGSIERLAQSFAMDSSNLSPQRKQAAIRILKDDAMLSPHSLRKAFKLIRRDTGFADMIVSIQNKDLRTLYIESEIDDI